MKKKMCFVLVCFCLSIVCFGQQTYPKEIQDVLDRVKKTAKTELNNYRFERKEAFRVQLMYVFQHPDTLYKKAEKYNLNIGILYDDEMRNRIVQLLSNEFSSVEEDSVVALCNRNSYSYLEKQIFQKSKIDTMQVFRDAIKKLYEDLERENKVDIDKKINYRYEFELFKQLELDTLSEYRKLYFSITEGHRKECIDDFLNYESRNYSQIAELSGYINDKRFIKPLIAALEKPKNFKREVVLEALARMKVEPYYTQYFEKRTRSLDEIKRERPNFRVEELVEVLRTQESFRELSKYLLSDVPYTIEISEEGGVSFPISNDAYWLIKDNIENEDLQELVLYGVRKSKENRQQVYDWMQKNYGKYKIRRIW